MKTMRNYDSDIILYAKGWYKKTDTLEDLKIIYGKRNGVAPEYLQMTGILGMVLDLAYTLGCFSTKHEFTKFFDECFQDYPRLGYKDNITMTRMLDVLLNHIGLLEVRNKKGEVVIILDKPDPDLLEVTGNMDKFDWLWD